MSLPMVFESDWADLKPAPIKPEWVTGGAPDAHNKVLFVSDDRSIVTILWRCAAGSFRWVYDEEETIYVVDGGMTLTYDDGRVQKVGKGDVVYFAAGSAARWDVDSHVHKVAVFRRPIPKMLGIVVAFHRKAASVAERLARLLRPAVPQAALSGGAMVGVSF
ncbi:MAG TPA: cupin domain-containing protein [Caulobacteraceae bacterium]|jgi:hypothetical protein